MTDYTFKRMTGSKKESHSTVYQGSIPIGEVWRELVNVTVSKLTEPRRMARKWRWFAKRDASTPTLGRGTRAAMLLGPGYPSRAAALEALKAL